jgi:hypothetical protein
VNNSDFKPSLSLAKNWRAQEELYFLKLFLDESRKPFAKHQAREINKPISTLKKVTARIKLLANFLATLCRCFFLSRNQILIFNHSNRIRKAPYPRSLYLSSVGLNNAIVFEDAELAVSNQSNKLYSFHVTNFGFMVAALCNKFYKVLTAKDERDYLNFYFGFLLWKLIFQLLKPTAIRLFVWYGKEHIIAAAKTLSIEVSDMQHGIIYQSHPFYNRSQNNSITNSHYLLPDNCYVYGEYWRSLLIKSGWQPDSVKITGYFLDTSNTSGIDIETPYILYTSQPHVTDLIISHIKSIREQASAKGINIVIAPHPSESIVAYEPILSARIKVYSTIDSYDLLSRCLVHISVSSTLLWEAMLFNKSSYVLNYGLEAMDLLTDLIKFGYGRPISDKMFPEPFSLPNKPAVDFFFAKKDESVFNLAS